MKQLQHETISFNDFMLDLTRGCLLHGVEEVKLRPKSFDVLKHLVENQGRLVSKDELIQAVWPNTAVTDDSLVQCLIEVRRALGDGGQQIVKTVPRRGYIFDAKVIRRDAVEQLMVYTEEVEGVRVTIEEEMLERNKARPELLPATRSRAIQRSRWTVFLSLGAVIVLTALLFTIYRNRNSRGESHSAPILSIAVLPLKNLSDDPANEYFSDGMTESLINALSKVGDLKVISRASVIRFKGNEADPKEVGRQLGVASVLEGSVRKDGESVRVAVRLVSTEDGHVLWAHDTHDRALGDIFALQDEIARNVVAGLRLELAPEGEQRLAKRYTDNVEAYQLYLKGRYLVIELYKPDPVKRGIEHFNKAIEIDPNYALAYAGLADAYYWLSNSYLAPQEAMPKARAAAEKALELDETLAEAHISLGLVKMYYDWDFAGAEREFGRAVELNPNDAMARNWYSWYLLFTGREEEAISEMRRAAELDPLSLKTKKDLGRVLYYARRYDEAIEQYQSALKQDANDSQTHWFLGITYVIAGRFSEALAQFQKARALDDNRFRLAWLGCAYAMSGKKGEARKVIVEMKSERGYVSPYNLTLVYAVLGEKDEAFRLLEKNYQERNEALIWARVDPLLDGLRSDPRFADLMRRVGFTP